LAYSEKKYQTFHSGSSTCRTASRIAGSVTGMSPPRSTGEDISIHRIASEPYSSKT
jgi:hypothetical protein